MTKLTSILLPLWAMCLFSAAVAITGEPPLSEKIVGKKEGHPKVPGTVHEHPAQEQPKPGVSKPRRADLYGDPLPHGALARLGSSFLRHPGLSDWFLKPDGQTLLTVGADGLLRTWDFATAKQLRTHILLHGSVFSPDGTMLLSCNAQRPIVWDLKSGKELASFREPKPGLGWWGYFFSPDGRTVSAREGPDRVTLWTWKTGNVREIHLPRSDPAATGVFSDPSNHACFSPDGKLLATGVGSQSPLCLWNVATGEEVRRFPCAATFSAFSPDARHLAAVSAKEEHGQRTNILHLWELGTGKEELRLPLEKDDAFYWCMAFSPDGKKIACASTKKISVRDTTTGKQLHQFLPGRISKVAFSPDGRMLLGSKDYRVYLWDLTTGEEINQRPGDDQNVNCLALSPDGKLVASGGISLWDVMTGRQLRTFDQNEAEGYPLNLGFSPDGSTLFSAHSYGEIHSWNTRTGQRLRTLQIKNPGPINDGNILDSYFFSPDFKSLATLKIGYGDGGKEFTYLDIWEPDTGKFLGRLSVPGYPSPHLAGDESTAYFTTNQHLTAVQLSTGRLQFQIPYKEPGPLALSPDGKLLAAPVKIPETADSKSPRWVVRLWETVTGKEVASLPSEPVKYLALRNDRELVTTHLRSLRVTDIATGQELLRYDLLEEGQVSFGGGYQQLCLSADGRRAVMSLADGTLLVWDLLLANRPKAVAGKKLTAEQLAAFWENLASDNPTRAYQSIWGITDTPDDSLRLLRQHLKPAFEKNFAKVRQLIKDLDDDNFTVREAAFRELEKLGVEAEPFLHQVLQGKVSVEVRKRVEDLLGRPPIVRSPEALRAIRSIQVLEHIGTPEARQVLETLAKGAAQSRLTQEATASLQRLNRRAPAER